MHSHGKPHLPRRRRPFLNIAPTLGLTVCALAGVPRMSSADTLDTRHGRLESTELSEDAPQLLFEGRPFKPAIEGNGGLYLKERFVVGRNDVVLVLNVGGTACPGQYRFVTVRPNGVAVATPEFGSCSDLIKTRQIADRIEVRMPVWSNGVARKQTTYVFRDGVVTENGVPVR